MTLKMSAGLMGHHRSGTHKKAIEKLDTFRIYSGSEPASVDDPVAGELLWEKTDCQMTFDVFSMLFEKADPKPWRAVILQDGQATHFRYTSSQDDTLVIQGSVGICRGDLFVSNDVFVKGVIWSLDWFTLGW